MTRFEWTCRELSRLTFLAVLIGWAAFLMRI
jgi:hypothetical protein